MLRCQSSMRLPERDTTPALFVTEGSESPTEGSESPTENSFVPLTTEGPFSN